VQLGHLFSNTSTAAGYADSAGGLSLALRIGRYSFGKIALLKPQQSVLSSALSWWGVWKGPGEYRLHGWERHAAGTHVTNDRAAASV